MSQYARQDGRVITAERVAALLGEELAALGAAAGPERLARSKFQAAAQLLARTIQARERAPGFSLPLQLMAARGSVALQRRAGAPPFLANNARRRRRPLPLCFAPPLPPPAPLQGGDYADFLTLLCYPHVVAKAATPKM